MMIRQEALAIWQAGVKAVDPFLLIERAVSLRLENGDWIFHFEKPNLSGEKESGRKDRITEREERLSSNGRLIVIGMGKATRPMAAAIEKIAAALLKENRILGWVNVPDNCVEPLQAIHVHGARPAAKNEPTERGIEGSKKIVELLNQTSEDDLILCLVSGGGSALLPLPVPEISLSEKLAVTKFLAAEGANIEELNTVRKELSLLKGGGLKRICRGKRLISLVLSDVLGDPVDVIASGATVDNQSGIKDALMIAEKYHFADHSDLSGVWNFLQNKGATLKTDELKKKIFAFESDYEHHFYLIIGNNETAVNAAAAKARLLGWSPVTSSARHCEGLAEETGLALYRRSCEFFYGGKSNKGIDCVIEGGEPVVKLVSEQDRGIGGRNQQLILAALIQALADRKKNGSIFPTPLLLSGGTDGEDGPTESAGAWFDSELLAIIENEIGKKKIDPKTSLEKNNAWHFFDQFGALINTGPTGTNVCDLRIALKEKNK